MKLILTEAEKKAATWLELDDESVGKLVKASQVQIVEHGKNKVADKEQDVIAFWAAGLILCSTASESNAETFKTTIEGVTSHGKSIGDWEIIIKRIDRNGT